MCGQPIEFIDFTRDLLKSRLLECEFLPHGVCSPRDLGDLSVALRDFLVGNSQQTSHPFGPDARILARDRIFQQMRRKRPFMRGIGNVLYRFYVAAPCDSDDLHRLVDLGLEARFGKYGKAFFNIRRNQIVKYKQCVVGRILQTDPSVLLRRGCFVVTIDKEKVPSLAPCLRKLIDGLRASGAKQADPLSDFASLQRIPHGSFVLAVGQNRIDNVKLQTGKREMAG